MKKAKIYFEEPKFFINEGKKTVTCKLKGTLDLPFEIFNIAGKKSPSFRWGMNCLHKYSNIFRNSV